MALTMTCLTPWCSTISESTRKSPHPSDETRGFGRRLVQGMEHGGAFMIQLTIK